MNTPPTHYDQAWKDLNEGLELARNGKRVEATEKLFQAARAFEKGQEYRLIPAVWEAVGKLLKDVQDVKNQLHSELDKTEPFPPTELSLDYRVISESTWHDFSGNHCQRLAWVYQWAAEHKERAGDFDTAQKLYFQAAHYVEQTKEAQTERPHWAARIYYRAVLNHIRFFGSATEAEPSEGKTIFGPIKKRIKGTSGRTTGNTDVALRKMHDYFCNLANNLKKPAKGYKQLAVAYSSLKSALLEAGNVIEARDMEKGELRASRKYHYAAGNFGRYLYFWMRTGGFQWFLVVWVGLVLVGFPVLYRKAGLMVSSNNSPATFGEAILYSLETAVIMGHQVCEAAALSSRLLAVVETSLSYFALGTALWYVTKKIE